MSSASRVPACLSGDSGVGLHISLHHGLRWAYPPISSPFPPRLQFPARVFVVTSCMCPWRGVQRAPPSTCSFLLSYALLSCCHCSKYLTSRRPAPLRPLLCSPFIPSGFAGPLPSLGSAVHLVFPLPPTPFPLFAVNAACQELV